MEYHEVASLFPLMDGEDYENLKNDIRKNGLQEAVYLHEGRIIDGRNRERACRELGIPLKTREWSGKGSLVAFVVSMNLHRRHLSSGQRAMIGEAMLPMLEDEAKDRMSQGGKRSGRTRRGENEGMAKMPYLSDEKTSREQAAKLVGTNPRYIQDAKMIRREDPELAKKVEIGEIGIRKARGIVQGARASKHEASLGNGGAKQGKKVKPLGVGTDRAHETINILMAMPKENPVRKEAYEAIEILLTIPQRDKLREAGFTLVLDWVRRYK